MSEEKDEDDNLLRPTVNSNIESPKCLSNKMKIIIIVSSIIVTAGIILTIILLLKDSSKDDINKDDNNGDIEVLDPIIIEPVSEYTHCIIWLHGLYATPQKFENLFKTEVPFAKKNNTKIILMRAPYQIISFEQVNTTSWFDLFSFPINNSDCYNFTDAIKSRKMVEKVINQEAKLLKGNYQNIYVGGHSQGACITLYTAYNFKETLGGVLACSGILFPQGNIEGDKSKLNVFLAHGDKDESIPFEFHKETVKRIENFEGVKKYYYEGHGHNIADFEKIDMGKFLNDTMVDYNNNFYLRSFGVKIISLLLFFY